MRILLLFTALTAIISCNNSSEKKEIPDKSNGESTSKEIIGIWELLKQSYSRNSELSLVQASDKEYLEIKQDGTCQDGRDEAKWFLSYTDDFIIDSISKELFFEISNLDDNSYKEYHRKIEPYQIKVTTENGLKYLYLTSLRTSRTRLFIRKN